MMDKDLAVRVFACIDNTTLGTTDTVASVEKFCRKTRSMNMTVAGVCVYPRFVPVAAVTMKKV